MADVKYTVAVDTTQAQSSLKKLNTKVGGSSKAFDGLKKAIAGFALASFVKSVYSMSNSMTDLSAATEVSVRSIIGFGKALAQNGGDVGKTNKALTTMLKTIGDAGEGIKLASDSFEELGLSMDSLNKMNSDEKLAAIVKALAGVDDVAKRTTLSMRIFGGSFRGIDIKGVSSDLGRMVAAAKDQAEAVADAGEASQNLKDAFLNLQIAATELLDPLSKLINKASESSKETDGATASWVKWTVGIVGAGAALTVLVVAGRGIASVVSAFKGMGQAIAGLTSAEKTIVAVEEATGGLIGSSNQLGLAVQSFLELNPTNWEGMWVGAGAVVSAAMDLLSEKFNHLGKTISDFFSENDSKKEPSWIRQLWNKIKLSDESLKKLQDRMIKIGLMKLPAAFNTSAQSFGMGSANASLQAAIAPKKDKGPDEEITKLLDSQVAAIARISKSYAERNKYTLDALKNEKSLIGLTSDEAAERNTVRQFTQDYKNEVKSLKSKLEQLNKAPKEHAEELKLINEQLVKVTKSYKEQKPAVVKLAHEITVAREQYEKELVAAEAVKRAAEDTARAIKAGSSYLQDMEATTKNMQNEFDRLDMNTMQKSLNGISRSIKTKLARDIKSLNDIRTDGNSDEIDKQIKGLEEAADKAIRKQSELAAQSYKHQRTFSYGWKKAFESYSEDAHNSAKSAERIFSKTTQGIEDMIVNLAKTGKFEWKDFAASILEELLRTQIKILTADIFGDATKTADHTAQNVLTNTANNAPMPQGGYGANPAGQQGGGNLWDGIKSIGSSIFGGNNGSRQGGYGMGSGSASLQHAQAQQQKPSMWDSVKSLGSSLFGGGSKGATPGYSGGSGARANSWDSHSSRASAPKSSGIWDSVKSVGKSLFSGFFADGGNIPKGKYGIVGERGPEMIGGPVGVTPMGGGSTNVTYNINANDAQSFQALVAADPGFIHAVASQGAKQIPGRR